MIQPRHDLTISFLKRWNPSGPWVLTAIDKNQKGIVTRTFVPSDDAQVAQWLKEQGDQERNLYFSVNPTTKHLEQKADRTEIASLSWLHVDIDPRAGENLEEEQQRALKLLQNPPGGMPPPTVIVFSGGGYQGFWKLQSPIMLDGTLEAAEDAKRWNLQIELLYGADNCHNVDRIMRLPGTISWPGDKKAKKGRRPALAELVEWHEDRIYPIEKFTKAPHVQSVAGQAAKIVKVSGNIKRLNSVDDLPEKVPNRCRVCIVQGIDPDDPRKHGSRSEWLFYVCCELVRSGVDDDTIFAIITDPNFAISASVLDKGSNVEKYALHQIQRAREHAIDPDLLKLNEKFAVIGNWNGKCRVIEEIYDENLARFRVTKQSSEDFRNRWMNDKKFLGKNDKGNDVVIPMGHWWLGHKNRRQFDTVVFAPGKETPTAYNLWRGFACDAKPGDCSLFLEHLRNNVCRGDEDHYRYLLGWMARAVQHPDSPGFSAIVMRGGQGTGKSFVAKIFGSLFGRHYMAVTDPKHLVGSFNAHLRDCVVLFGDEAFYAGDKKHESILKMLITEELIVVEAKGVDAESSANCVHLLMASNDQWVVPAGFDDRRFFVLDISDDHKGDHAYFQAINRQMDVGGREALLHFLLTYDLTDFNVREVPKTEALRQQKMFSMSPEEEWWFMKLKEGRVFAEHTGWRQDICTNDLTADFLLYTRGFNITRRGNATRLGHALRRFCPGMSEAYQARTPVEVMMPDGTKKMIQRPYFYKLPTLKECREVWDKNFGGPFTWNEEASDEQAPQEPPF